MAALEGCAEPAVPEGKAAGVEEPATTPPPPPLPLVYERVSSPERRPPPEVAAVPVAVGAGPPPDSWRRVLVVEVEPRATELVAVPVPLGG